MKYYSGIKTNKIMPFATKWMTLEMFILSKVSQRKTNIILYHFYVEYKKNDTNELIYETETDSQMLSGNLWLPKGKDWSGG